jgi:hypothetical protein
LPDQRALSGGKSAAGAWTTMSGGSTTITGLVDSPGSSFDMKSGHGVCDHATMHEEAAATITAIREAIFIASSFERT